MLILLSIALVVTIVIASRGNVVTSAVGGTIATIFAPIQRVASNVTSNMSNAISELFGTSSLQREYAALLKRNSTLEMENQQYREQAKENARLTELLQLRSNFPSWEMVGARVISASPTYWQDTFIIDKGKNDGIEKDMVVVMGGNVVGRVVEISASTARVMTLIDSQSAISGIIERSRENGIVKGLSVVGTESRLCRMEYLSQEADLTPGDRVLTSGLGGIYPKGLLIGEVMEIATGEGEADRYAIVKPAVDLAHIEEVLIIINATSQLPGVFVPLPTAVPLLPTPPASSDGVIITPEETPDTEPQATPLETIESTPEPATPEDDFLDQPDGMLE